MKPFKVLNLQEPNTFQQLFNKQPKENTIIEIRNNLAAIEFEDLPNNFIDNISEKYGGRLFSTFHNEICEILEEFISYQFSKDDINEINFDEIRTLSDYLQVESGELDSLLCKFSKAKCIETVKKIIENRKLIQDSQKELENIQKILEISDNDFNLTVNSLRTNYVKSIFENALSDGKYSPDEERYFLEICKSLEVNPIHDEETLKLISKSKLLWNIENEPLKKIETELSLPKTEECYFSTEIKWYEYRKIIKGLRYAGTSYRLKIVKGWYLRSVNFNFQKKSEDTLTKIDEGNLFLTNKRIIFIGKLKTTNIRLDRILDFKIFSNGVEIVKDSGKNPFLSFDKRIDIFSSMLAKLIG